MSEATDNYVMLLHNDEGNPYVLVSDAPDAPTTVGAEKTRFFEGNSDGWPEKAMKYAAELSQANGNCPVEYEWWAMRHEFEE